MRRIWEWIKTWFEKQDKLDGYSPSQRRIFTYFNGTRHVKADPMVLYGRWVDKEPTLSLDIKASRTVGNKFAKQAYTDSIKTIREIYEVPVYDEVVGLTEPELLELHAAFARFCEEVKKNSQPSPTSVEDQLRNTVSMSRDVPVMSNTSASGSTANGHSIGVPMQFPSEVPSPSDNSSPESTTTSPTVMEKAKQE